MRVILDATPFDLLPMELVEGLRKSIEAGARMYGLQVDIVKAPSIQEAIDRFHSRVYERDRLEAEARAKSG